jgi:Tfp pilus assembly protein PilX
VTPRRLPLRRQRLPRRERGIVVFVALIAVVLLSLAAVALMRSVHTSTMVVGNLAFRQAAQVLSAAAVERAIYEMFPPSAVIADLTVHDTARNYFASIQPNQDRNGVPRPLQGDPAVNYAPLGAQVITDNPTGNVARYVVERMCDDDAIGMAATQKDCEMIPPKQSAAKETQLKKGITLPRIPYYRVTVRVDGPGNSVAYSQAMIR